MTFPHIIPYGRIIYEVINLKNKILKKVIFIVAIMSFIITIVAAVFLPRLVIWYGENVREYLMDSSILTFLYITMIPFLVILIEVIKLSKALVDGLAFNKKSIKSLKVINISAFIDFIIYLIATAFIYRNLVCLVITVATFMVFMISIIVLELVKNGIELQEEVDLTV